MREYHSDSLPRLRLCYSVNSNNYTVTVTDNSYFGDWCATPDEAFLPYAKHVRCIIANLRDTLVVKDFVL
jgi:hypothetical protein